MPDKKVLVLGGNFAGLTAALSLKHELQDGVDVTVVAKSDPRRMTVLKHSLTGHRRRRQSERTPIRGCPRIGLGSTRRR
jgi:NADH dehydrogenase FAD-containing subunit